MKYICYLAFVTAFSVLAISSFLARHAEAPTVAILDKITETPKEIKLTDLPSVLQRIAWCESRNRQFNPDGSIYRGEINPNDTGLFQINTTYWFALANQLGYDIYTEQGNIKMALYIYEKNGTTPWNWSKSCWGVSSLQETKTEEGT